MQYTYPVKDSDKIDHYSFGRSKKALFTLAAATAFGVSALFFTGCSSSSPSPSLPSSNLSSVSPEASDFVAKTATIEAGNGSLKASDLLLEKGHTAVFAAEGLPYDPYKLGVYPVEILVDGAKYTVMLTVRDTVAPTATPKQVTVHINDRLLPEECVTDIKDATKVQCTFKTQPSLSYAGTENVIVLLTDEANNQSEITVPVTVLENGVAVPEVYTIEAGTPFPPIEAFVGLHGEGKYITDISVINTSLIGEHTVQLQTGGKNYTTKIIIKDTTPPAATVTPQNAYFGADFPSADSFISNIVDAGPVHISYDLPPVAVAGTERTPVRILITDQAGNKTVYESYFKMMTDTQPPVFISYPTELETDVGTPVIWRAMTSAEDNLGTVELSLDTSHIDMTVPGIYTVYLVAKDRAGNETRKEVTLTLHDNAVTKEMMNKVLENILGKIITEGMSHEEIFHAIFRHLRLNLSYSNAGVHDDVRREAYLGLTTRKSGDCFTYYAAAKEMFEYLGYEVRTAKRGVEYAKKSGSNHFWLMVNCGTAEQPAWYHFDATPQAGKFSRDTYMMTDAQLIAYTNYRAATSPTKLYYYTYDEGTCPPSATEILVDLYLDSKFYP